VGFAEGADKLVNLSLQFGLAGAGAMAGTAGERGPATVQELVSPGGDRGLRDTLATGGLLHRHLAANHRQHDA
jgi:hypothetical protein